MDQIVKYSEIKTLNDIAKNYAQVPMTPIQDDNGAVKFSIADYADFKSTVVAILKQYDTDFIVTDDNVSIYEKEGAQISNLIKKIKKDSKDYKAQFTDLLDAEVKDITNILTSYYDIIHNKTKSFRESKKIDKETAIIADIQEAKINADLIEVSVIINKNDFADFKAYCDSKNIKIKE